MESYIEGNWNAPQVVMGEYGHANSLYVDDFQLPYGCRTALTSAQMPLFTHNMWEKF